MTQEQWKQRRPSATLRVLEWMRDSSVFSYAEVESISSIYIYDTKDCVRMYFKISFKSGNTKTIERDISKEYVITNRKFLFWNFQTKRLLRQKHYLEAYEDENMEKHREILSFKKDHEKIQNRFFNYSVQESRKGRV